MDPRRDDETTLLSGQGRKLFIFERSTTSVCWPYTGRHLCFDVVLLMSGDEKKKKDGNPSCT